MKYDIVVIGGGPAGIMSAIHAAEKGAVVCIIEHMDRIGKKILSTGNGKCNLTNMVMTPDCYRSESEEAYFHVAESFSPAELREFFYKAGLVTKEKNGYVYPFSEQASAVLDVLRHELARLGIHIMTETEVKSVEKGYVIHTDKGTVKSKALIIACGSKCAPKTGSDGTGYALASSMGHSVITPVPALVQIRCKEKVFREIAGVRTEAAVTLIVNGREIISDRGELQLTDYGISGIPVFQISRYIKRSVDRNENPVVRINFMPQFGRKELNGMIACLVKHNPVLEIQYSLNGILNKKISAAVLKKAGIDINRPCRTVSSSDIDKISEIITDYRVTPVDTNGFENAQVCAGGVALTQVDMCTMESRLCKNLYFAGEILDVDGKCGGYNLHWAFASGRLAGNSAAEGIL